MTISDGIIDAHFSEQKQYLESRGIDNNTTTKLQLEFITSTKLNELGYKLSNMDKAILWRIHDFKGADTGAIGARLFYKKSFGIEAKGPKFAPPAKQIPRLYFPPLWSHNSLEYNDIIVLCESYLKADILCMLGYKAIGVSGCWGWSHEHQLLADFRDLPWQDLKLKFVVSFDSNVGEGRKRDLNLAVSRLSAEMENLKVDTYLSQLPPMADNTDWGIDDYYVEHGETSIKELFMPEKLVKIDSDIAQHLKILNREVAYIGMLDRIVEIHLPSKVPMTVNTFKTGRYADRVLWKVGENGKPKKLRLATEWIEWPDRLKLNDMVYKPGAERIYCDSFNTWTGMGCDAQEDEIWYSLWEDWLLLAFPIESERDWFCSWWACQLQEPGIKMNTSMVMLGKSGVGKGWVAQIMRHIFGSDNSASASLIDIAGNFNSQYSAKQLLVIEEAEMPRHSDGLYAKLKDMITNEHLVVNTKGVPAYQIDNHVNVCIQSNNVDVLKLDSFDRRFAVFDIVNDQLSLGGDSFWALRMEGMKSGLPEAVYQWLLDYDTSSFDPYGTAPDSKAKNRMYDVGLSGREEFVNTLVADPEAVLPDKGMLYTSSQLESLYQSGEEVTPGQSMAMSKVLAKFRLSQYNEGKTTRGPDGKPARWWLVREGKLAKNPLSSMSKYNLATLK